MTTSTVKKTTQKTARSSIRPPKGQRLPAFAAATAVELNWYTEDDTVKVTPRDFRRFEIQKHRAIEILQLASQEEAFNKQFPLLLDTLARWIEQYQAKIQQAVLTLQDGALTFVVVRLESRFDEPFEEALAQLELDIARDSDLALVRVSTTCLPSVSDEALRSFVDERLLLTYHGNRD